MVNILWDRSTEEESGKFKGPETYSWWKEKISRPITNIDDFLRNMSTGNTIRKLTIGPTFGAHGQRKIAFTDVIIQSRGRP